MIVYATATCNSRMDQTKECIRSINEFNQFDRKVIIISESPEDYLSAENRDWLYEHGCEVYIRKWDDDMPAMRNAYLDKCHVGDWIIVSDSDEWFCIDFCKDIKQIIKTAEEKGLNVLLINSHDVTTWVDGKTTETVSGFFKNLIFKKDEATKYEGVGQEKKVHETLILKENKVTNLDQKYYYQHIKEWHEIWERATRNVFIGGGGNNVGKLNEEWTKLREITKEIGVDTWPKFRQYMIDFSEKYGILSTSGKKIYDWIVTNRRMGYDWENEMCDVFRWFRYLHPELIPEDTDIITEEIPERAEIMKLVEQAYLDVLGRNADTPGKMLYTRLIEQGRISITDVRNNLYASDERKARQPSDKDEEVIKTEKVKVDVNVHITDEVIQDIIINKSKIYREKYLRPLKLGLRWDALLAIPKKEETGGKGDDDTSDDGMNPFIEMFKHHVPPDKYQTILNVGAGSGVETNMLIEAGYEPVGITYGKDNLEIAKERYNIILVEMDMHSLELPANLFDGIFSVQTFEHAFSPWLHILEMRRVLKDGGRILIDVPDARDYVMQETIWHTSVLYPDQIRALFTKAGFNEVTDLSVKHRTTFIFEKIPDGKFKMWDYVQHIMKHLNKV